jgi:hypothetical protein
MFGPQVAEPPQEIELEGRKAKQYQFRGAPPIVVVRLDDGAMSAGTRDAVSAAVRAEGPYAITGDPQFRPLLDSLKEESSKAVLVHIGRAVQAAAAMPGAPDEAKQIAPLMSELTAMVVTNEQTNEFVIRASATGLPNVPNLVQAAARMHAMSQPPVHVRVAEQNRLNERSRALRIERATPEQLKP